MFWNKKEEKRSLPDLPPLKMPFISSLSAPPEQHSEEAHEDSSSSLTERHNLPSFPDSLIEKGFSQAAIKDAISHGADSEEPEIVNQLEPKKFKTIEMNEQDSPKPFHPSATTFPSQNTRSSSLLIGPPPSLELEMNRPVSSVFPPAQKGSDIFIKIDKFNSSRKALSSAQEQLEHIVSLLKKIREIKMREEQELAAWEKEMANVKARIKDINENIFEKLE